MKIQVWELEPHVGLKPLPGGIGAIEVDDDRQPRWAEVHHTAEVSLEEVVRPLKLHPMVLRELLDDERTNRIILLGKALLLEFPCAVDEHAEHHPYVSILLCGRFLLTVLRRRGADREVFLERLKHHLQTEKPNILMVVAHILEELVEETMDLGGQIRDQVEALTERVLEAPLRVSLSEIQATTRSLQHFALVTEDQIFSLDSLVGAITTMDNAHKWTPFIDHLRLQLSHVLKLVSRLTEQLRSLHGHGVGARNDVDSSRLKTLTILSALFLPLNLIAGIYGMNFSTDGNKWNMPELHWAFGYLYAIGLMAAVSTTLLLFFRWRGWLGRSAA